MPKNNHYFISDTHLGIPNHELSLEREKKIVRWLNSIENDAKAIYLLGDIFDFWFEFKYVVPKGFVRLLGKLADLTDKGIEVHFFYGNHDLWMKDYFKKELGIIIHKDNKEIIIDNKVFLIGHGDELDLSDKKHIKRKAIFKNPLAQKFFGSIHPRWSLAIAHKWSMSSRLSHSREDMIDKGENEPLVKYCKEAIKHKNIDFFIFGHRHLITDYDLGNGRKYMNAGNWVYNSNYVVWNGEKLELKKFE